MPCTYAENLEQQSVHVRSEDEMLNRILRYKHLIHPVGLRVIEKEEEYLVHVHLYPIANLQQITGFVCPNDNGLQCSYNPLPSSTRHL